MKIISSIKHKSLALLISLTLGLTALYLGLAVIISFVVEDVIISKLLQKHVHFAEQQYQTTGKLPDLDLGFIQLYESPSALPHELYKSIQQSSGDQEIFTPDKTHYHFKTLDLSNEYKGYIVAEVSDLLVVSQNPSLFVFFLIGLMLALLLAIYLANQFSKQIVNPIVLLTKAVKSGQISKQSFSLPNFKYELDYLSNTFQKAFNDLEQALAREKNFTTDVGHELRTPLTILKNNTALIEQRGYKDSDLTEMRSVCLQMENTVSVLLALARAESIEKKRCNLKMILEQAILTHENKTHDITQANETNITLDIDAQFALVANPALLTLLANNLIANAIQHAQSHQLSIRQQDNSLIFENTVHEPSPGNVMASGVKSQSSQGVGQGLYLVTRIVESFGWRYELTQSNNIFSFNIYY
jgi:signal transduction histidine kinase